MLERWKVPAGLTARAALAAVLSACNGSPASAPPSPVSMRGITVHASRRYFQDPAGKPLFLLGYYGFNSIDPNYTIAPSVLPYSDVLGREYRQGLNYIRPSLGINRIGSTGSPAAFRYVDGKADLDQLEPGFWRGLEPLIRLAKHDNVLVHLSIFDGVNIRNFQRNGESNWWNSYWNAANQIRDFFGELDTNRNGLVDEYGEFYRPSDLLDNKGVGYYQRKLLDTVVSAVERLRSQGYDNVFFEIGNELNGSRADWNEAVYEYVKSKTSVAVTMNASDFDAAQIPPVVDGVSAHEGDTPAAVKSLLARMVGRGYPAWLDPDGSALGREGASASDLRKAAWYSFTGGAAAWGGFADETFEGRWNATKAQEYTNLAKFIQISGVHFWEMLPRHDLITDGATENSLLAKPGSEYVAYIARASTAQIDLTGVSGSLSAACYNPRLGLFSMPFRATGGGMQTVVRPSGWSDDWVIYLHQ